MELRNAIGQTIHQLRTERGLLLRSFPHIALGYLSEIERGVKNPSSEMLEHIADTLDISTIELLQKVCETLERNKEWH